MGSRRQRTRSSSTSTATTTPNVPSWIQGPYSTYFGEVGGMVGQNPTGIGASPLQQQAWQGASQLGSSPWFAEAADATRGQLGFMPESVQALWNANNIAGPNAGDYQASLMGPAPTVSAGQLRDTDLSGYLNPYTNEVIDRSLGDLNRYRQMAIADTQGAATRSGAYGGSRHGVADALTNERFIDQAGNLAAGLRQAGYGLAQQMALTDIGNRFGADTFNAQNALQVGARNQDAANSFLASLNAARMQTQLANQGAAESAAGRSMQGQLANQGAGLEGARQRLAAAAQLAGLGTAAGNDARANIAMQGAMGADQQANDPVQARLRYLAQLGAMLGVNPDMFTGQTINQSGQSSGTTTQRGSWGDMLGQAIGIGSALFSDRRLKRDVERSHTDANGLRWYRYRYLWDADAAPKRLGVMADEAPQQAVIMHPSGYMMVDYSKLGAA